MSEDRMSNRMRVLAAFVAFLFAALVTRLWFLQVLAAEEYQERAESNRVRIIPEPAPRGRILDANGRVLVDNRRSIQVVVNRRHVENPEELLFRLSEVLEVPVNELAERYEDPTYLPYQPVPVADDVPERKAAYLVAHRREFPGVSYRVVGVRDYVHGSLAAHVLGYLGEINEEELKSPAFRRYRPGDEVGRGGVEQHYEEFLRGKEGYRSIQVDAQGRSGQVLGSRRPEPGNDLYLSIDLGLQTAAEESLAQGVRAANGVVTSEGRTLNAKAGAVVALDPNTGHVRAMASFPAYNPEVFVDGLSQREWRRFDRDPTHPLNNRAIQGLYPAASTFKPFVAAAAVKAGIAGPEGYFPCPPTFEVPGDTSGTVFHNWHSGNDGFLSLAGSLERSCDTVYYQFGLDFWRLRDERGDVMQRQLRKWGFGRPTGVDVPGELEGRVPDSEWKQQVHELYPKYFPEGLWLPGDNINMSIGQGDLLVTPLQLASAYAAIANGGTLYRPEVGLRVEAPDGTVLKAVAPREIRRIPMQKKAREQVLAGLRAAVQGVGGTATTAFAGFPGSVAGKTGTAEVIVDGQETTHSWFAAFAPAEDPEILVVAIVEEGGHGSQVAAPIVRRILEQYFGITPSAFRIGVATD
ncbi:MAG TPA: penicillin-binding protein 2 [Actinomycetota bacterium]